jgi:hypothetical protein
MKMFDAGFRTRAHLSLARRDGGAVRDTGRAMSQDFYWEPTSLFADLELAE